jgi:hypothetical protein
MFDDFQHFSQVALDSMPSALRRKVETHLRNRIEETVRSSSTTATPAVQVLKDSHGQVISPDSAFLVDKKNLSDSTLLVTGPHHLYYKFSEVKKAALTVYNSTSNAAEAFRVHKSALQPPIPMSQVPTLSSNFTSAGPEVYQQNDADDITRSLRRLLRSDNTDNNTGHHTSRNRDSSNRNRDSSNRNRDHSNRNDDRHRRGDREHPSKEKKT